MAIFLRLLSVPYNIVMDLFNVMLLHRTYFHKPKARTLLSSLLGLLFRPFKYVIIQPLSPPESQATKQLKNSQKTNCPHKPMIGNESCSNKGFTPLLHTMALIKFTSVKYPLSSQEGCFRPCIAASPQNVLASG